MPDLGLARAALDPAIAARPALVAEGVTYSFGELAARTAIVRTSLAAEGIDPGARVAILAQNRLETLLAIHALIDLGATLIPIHPRLTPAEADVILADAAPALTLREADLVSLAAPVSVSVSAPVSAPVSESALAMVYTSGTTGRPKGAVLSRRAFLASAAGSAENLGWLPEDRWILCMPLCHVGGLSILTRCLLARRAVILEGRFDPDAVLASIVRHRATLLSVVPTMLATLLERDAGGTLAGLRAILVGGAAAPFALLEECGRRGVPALATYGLTEACSQVTAQRPARPYHPARGSGAPLPGVSVRIGDGDQILVRGPTLMSGYWRGPDRPLDPALRDGWLATGDLGMIDDAGHLHVHARRTDLVVTGGENVYPAEVEQCLESFPGVRRALVFGTPDPRWGQIVSAALEIAEGLDLAALANHVAGRLAPHKRPRRLCAVTALPLTSSGKLDRRNAVDRYAALLRSFP